MEIDMATLWSTYILPWTINATFALLIFFVGRALARWIANLLARRMAAHKLDELLVRLTRNTVFYLLLVVVIIAALNNLGVDTTSALAAP